MCYSGAMDHVTENIDKFNTLRAKYPEFIYQKYAWSRDGSRLTLAFTYAFEARDSFTTELDIYLPDEVSDEIIAYHEDYIFRIGLMEALSYWKAHCSPTMHILCGTLSGEEVSWWIDTYYDGMGEFCYRNGLLSVDKDSWITFVCDSYNTPSRPLLLCELPALVGSLIAFTGGKDSTLVLGLMRDSGLVQSETFFINNTVAEQREAIKTVLGVDTNPDTLVSRSIHPRLLAQNKEGALNGHTPFSAIAGFIGVFIASLRRQAYVIVGNEASANEATVIGTTINHQYSKSLVFEKRFQEYIRMVWPEGPEYFSLLRPLSELGVVALLKQYTEVMPAVSSCNVKNKQGLWCAACPKCLFSFIAFSAVWDVTFASELFGTNMFNDTDHMPILEELTGVAETKPFECVGTVDETLAALAQVYAINPEAAEMPLLAEFWEKNADFLPEAEAFGRIVCEFHEHSIPEPYFVALIEQAQGEVCNG